MLCELARDPVAEVRRAVAWPLCLAAFSGYRGDAAARRALEALARVRRPVVGIRWVLHIGARRRKVPAEYGRSTTAWRWYEHWCVDGTWQRLAATPRPRRPRGCARGRSARTHLAEVDGLSRVGRVTVAANAGQEVLTRAEAGAFSPAIAAAALALGTIDLERGRGAEPSGDCTHPNALSSRFMDASRRSLQSSPGMQQSSGTAGAVMPRARDIIARAVLATPSPPDETAEPGRHAEERGERFARLGFAR
ncbi:transposase [Nannocystis sp. ILAH1]|uniref:transposase n=1 Tax=Nannocystis sp. ILAH1 TaxID=2996789 RepID=UPI00226E8BF2|nr:transposase [Nannocystis sp. ILAH1]MCY0992206.1 transposase [Nannocystis sp. ILAH1]